MTVETVTPESIGAQIGAAIKTRSANPTFVAAHIGVSEATLRRFIKGTHNPSFLQVLQLSELLDYPIDWFVNGQEVAA